MNESGQEIVDSVLSTDSTILTEYLVVSDTNSKVIKLTTDYKEAVKLANLIRSAGGEVTLFKSLKT